MGVLRSKCELQSIEADFGEGAVTVYWRPQSLAEMDAISKAGEQGPGYGLAEALLRRARKKDGSRMFDHRADHPHRNKVLNDFDPDEIIRVVTAMNKREGDPGN